MPTVCHPRAPTNRSTPQQMCPYEKCSTRSLVCTIVVAFYSAVATRGLPVKRFGEQSSLLFIARLYLQPSNPPNFTETSSNLCCAAMATTGLYPFYVFLQSKNIGNRILKNPCQICDCYDKATGCKCTLSCQFCEQLLV